MKKLLLTCTLFSLGLGAAYAQEQPNALWGNLFGGTVSSGDQSVGIAVSADGDVLWLNTANTDANGADVSYAGDLVMANDTKTGNLVLLCTDASGALRWQAYSTTADAMSGQGGVAVDAQGNVVIAAKVRQCGTEPMNLIGADSQAATYGIPAEKAYYQIMLAKLSADGKVLWTKAFDQSTAPAPAASGSNATFTSDAVSVSALTVDDNGCIYVGGYYRSEMTIDGVTLQPQNVSSWNGDSQGTCGNMYIVKLDGDGHYLASAVGEGEIGGVSAVQALQWSDGHLYTCGYAKGEGSFTFAGKTLTPTDVNSPIVGSLDTDLNADWLKCCPGETVDGKSALQNVGLSVYGDNLWIAGQFNQKISDPADAGKCVAATQGSLREGFAIKFDKNTGEWLASADSRVDFPEITKLGGYFKVIQNAADLSVAYIYGYTMDATQGIFLRKYDAATLTPVADCAWNIVTGGGVPSAVASAYDAATNSLYLTGRGNKAFTLMGESEITTPATSAWDVLMACFALPAATDSSIAISPEGTDTEIYDITGRYVGRSAQGLRPGIYISASKKFIVR